MENWKSHVTNSLLRRDRAEKLPFVGVFTSLSQLEERFDARKQFLEETEEGPDQCGVGSETRLLQLQLRESEHLAEKLSQTVSDLTTVLHLKDAEVQHWHSSVARQRQEVLTLAKGGKALRAKLWDHEYTIERQNKELTALQKEQAALQEALAQGRGEKEELLQRWMAEKMQEAERLNKYNDAQERWQRLAQHLKKNVRKEMEKSYTPTPPSSCSCASETSAASRCGTEEALQRRRTLQVQHRLGCWSRRQKGSKSRIDLPNRLHQTSNCAGSNQLQTVPTQPSNQSS